MIETQMAQIATAIPNDNNEKILGQPVNSLENIKTMTMRGGKSTHDLQNPNHAARKQKRMTRRRTFYINKNTKRVRRGNDTT
jgi:hypothetical protein